MPQRAYERQTCNYGTGRQVIDLAGMSPINMIQHVRREDAQSEWQHNMDFCPETLNKVSLHIRLGI